MSRTNARLIASDLSVELAKRGRRFVAESVEGSAGDVRRVGIGKFGGVLPATHDRLLARVPVLNAKWRSSAPARNRRWVWRDAGVSYRSWRPAHLCRLWGKPTNEASRARRSRNCGRPCQIHGRELHRARERLQATLHCRSHQTISSAVGRPRNFNSAAYRLSGCGAMPASESWPA